MSNDKKQIKEGIFDAADRLVAKFFDGMSNNAANQIIKKAEKAKLPKDVIDDMKELDDMGQQLRDKLKKLNKSFLS